MRLPWLLLLVFGLLAATAAADDKAGKGDKEKIQGTWAVVSGEPSCCCKRTPSDSQSRS